MAAGGDGGVGAAVACPGRSKTAIFCQNDRTAIGCYEALKEAGLPQDISVVGDDDEAAISSRR